MTRGWVDDELEEWRRPRPATSELRRDYLLAVAFAAVAGFVTILVNSMGTTTFGETPSLAEQLAWSCGMVLVLAVRRQFPEACVIVLGILFIGSQVRQNGENLVPSVALFLAIHSLGAWGRNRLLARWVRIAVIVAMFGWLTISFFGVIGDAPPEFPRANGPLDPLVATVLYQFTFNVAFFVAAYTFGNVAWESARRLAKLEETAERLHRSQEENARQAVVAERVRIARDLHDVVAHHVSVMGVQAAAARRVLDSKPPLARQALETVEQTARTAVQELRGLLGVLRSETGPVQPDDEVADGIEHQAAPGLANIEELVSETRATGVDVTLQRYGEERAVPAAMGLSAYRIVQEALTNTVKHAGAHSVDVRVRYLQRSLEIEVTDDGRGGLAKPRAAELEHGAGHGVIGMRERVAVHGGDLEVGPRRDGGYRVRASLPLAGMPNGSEESGRGE